MWGGVSIDGRTDLHVLDRGRVTARRYRDEVLGPIVRPYAGAVGEWFLLVPFHTLPGYVQLVWISKVLRLWTDHQDPLTLIP